jgi:predicted O-methyltransferase YrrM
LVPYIKHLIRSGSKYDIHSPFVYKIYKEILKDHTRYPEYDTIDTFRRKLLDSNETVFRADLGALNPGSDDIRKHVPVSKIIKASSVKTVDGHLLFRLVRWFKPRTILELGTSLGISTLYMALGNPEANIISIEGNRETLDITKRNFEEIGIKNIRLVPGSFDERLASVLAEIPSPDLIFFDGNHRKEPTLNYFNLCMQHMHKDSLFIFHDIHWSEGMEQAWNEITSHPSVTVTIDLFRIGLVFFNDHLSREDFILNWR